MQIKDMFRKKIDREIQGVIIVGQGEDLLLVPDGTGIPLGLQLEGALPHSAGEKISDIVHCFLPQICAVM